MYDPTDDDLEDLMQTFTSPDQVKKAMKEKKLSEQEKKEQLGERLKKYPKPQRQIDLHEHTSPQALLAIERFVENSQAQRLRTIRIVTGRGLHSKEQQSVLPQLTEDKLKELKQKNKVLAYKWAKDKGSLIVYLT